MLFHNGDLARHPGLASARPGCRTALRAGFALAVGAALMTGGAGTAQADLLPAPDVTVSVGVGDTSATVEGSVGGSTSSGGGGTTSVEADIDVSVGSSTGSSTSSSTGSTGASAGTTAGTSAGSGSGVGVDTTVGANGGTVPVEAPTVSAPVDGQVLPVKVNVAVPLVSQVAPGVDALTAGVELPAVVLPEFVTNLLAHASGDTKTMLNELGVWTQDTPLSVLGINGATAGIADVSVDADPLASACVQATGTGTAIANTDLEVVGIDASSPLIETLPGVLDSCPADGAGGTGTGTGTGTGSTGSGAVPGGQPIVSADATVGDLANACVRVTDKVVPVQATAVALDVDLIQQLTDAGVDIESLVVPCPADADGNGNGGNGGGGNGGGGNGGDDVVNAGDGGSDGNGATEAASAIPAASSLAFTGVELAYLLALALVLVALGALAVRRSRATA